jgi:hypothetical protein
MKRLTVSKSDLISMMSNVLKANIDEFQQSLGVDKPYEDEKYKGEISVIG